MVVYSLPRSNKRVASFNDDIVITEFHFFYSIYIVYISYLNTSAPDNAITASARHGTLVTEGPRGSRMCAQISPSVSGSIPTATADNAITASTRHVTLLTETPRGRMYA